MRNRRMAKKGGMHTIEAFIAFLIVTSFIIMIMPGITKIADTSSDKVRYINSALRTLDQKGILRDQAYSGNLSGINQSLYGLLPETYNFTVSMSTANATHMRLSGNYSFNYTAGDNLDHAFLEVAFASAQNPKIIVNGNTVFENTGSVSGTVKSIDLTGNTVTGQNNIGFNFTGASDFTYRLLVLHADDLTGIPAKKKIYAATYVLAGAGSNFQPVELRVYTWD